MASKKKKSVARGARGKAAGKPARRASRGGARVAVARTPGRQPMKAVTVKQLTVTAVAPTPGKVKGGKSGKGGKAKKGAKVLNPVQFTVVLANSRVSCVPANGNRLVRRQENRDISWRAASPTLQFELVFSRVDFDGAGRGASDWPFQSPPPGGSGSSTGVVSYFEGTLRADPDAWTAYKYDVHAYVNGARVASLDPMIIIGKL
jgi:hypothetical protein